MKKLLLLIVILASTAYAPRTFAVGTNYIQRLPDSSYKVMNWCGFYGQGNLLGYSEGVDANGYTYASTTPSPGGSPTTDMELITDHSGDCPVPDRHVNYQLPVPLDGLEATDNFRFYYVTTNAGNPNSIDARWIEADGSTQTNNQSRSVETYSVGGVTYRLYQTATSTGFLADTGDPVEGLLERIVIGSNGGTDETHFYGLWYTTTDLFAQINSVNDFLDFMDGEYLIESGFDPFADTSTRIVSFEPDQWEVINPELSGEETDAISFDVTWFFNSIDYEDVDSVILEFYNLDRQISYTPIVFPIIASGFTTEPGFIELSTGRYAVIISFYNEETDIKLGTKAYNFTHGSNYGVGGEFLGRPTTLEEAITAFEQQLASNPNVRFATSGTATTTDSFFGDFLNVPELLKSKVPFAYFYQMKTILEQAVTSTSSTALVTGTYNFVFPTGPSSTTSIPIDFFSTTTITHFIPPTMQTIMRGLMVAITYIGFGMYLYRRSQRLL